MSRPVLSFALVLATLAACAGPPPQQIGSDGRPLPQVYQIRAADTNAIQFRMLDAVNSLRQAAGAPSVATNDRLRAAAATHARDMAAQNRPWHFGSDGSSPIDRLQRVGYPGRLIGETISETFESELETLAAWMQSPDSRAILLDRRANQMGFDWYQEPNGKIWWTLVMGQG